MSKECFHVEFLDLESLLELREALQRRLRLIEAEIKKKEEQS